VNVPTEKISFKYLSVCFIICYLLLSRNMVRVVPSEKGGEIKQFFIQELNFVFYFCNRYFNSLSTHLQNETFQFSFYNKRFITES